MARSECEKGLSVLVAIILISMLYVRRQRSAVFLSALRPNATIAMITLVSDSRRPHSVIGSVALRTPYYLYVDGKFIPKACGRYSPECLREDHALILENVCLEAGFNGIIVKEDDFEACIPPERFMDVITYLGLDDRITVLGYGTGLFYVPRAKCALVASLWRSCSGPVDDCLNRLSNTVARTAHVIPPLAVHRHRAGSIALHQHKCDPLCYVSCWDSGNYESDYFDASEWLKSHFNVSTRRPRNFSCNHSDTPFDAVFCYSPPP